jgi:hypothetical protein
LDGFILSKLKYMKLEFIMQADCLALLLSLRFRRGVTSLLNPPQEESRFALAKG